MPSRATRGLTKVETRRRAATLLPGHDCPRVLSDLDFLRVDLEGEWSDRLACCRSSSRWRRVRSGAVQASH
jgi:hypothetical protein